MRELVENDRVIGGITPKCSQRSVDLYKVFVRGECVVTNARTAEMAKLTENSCRDVQIAFANELSMVCDRLDINVWELIGLATGILESILQPGPELVVTVSLLILGSLFLKRQRKRNSFIPRGRLMVPNPIRQTVKITIADFLQAHPEITARDITNCLLWFTFKPDIDDLRESPAMQIVKEIVSLHSGNVIAVEPNISKVNDSLEQVSLQSFDVAKKLILISTFF